MLEKELVQELSGIFRGLAQRTVRDFPTLAKCLIAATPDHVVYSAPVLDICPAFAKRTTEAVKSSFQMHPTWQAFQGPLRARDAEQRVIPIALIGVHMDKALQDALRDTHGQKVFKWYVNHEIGHLLDPTPEKGRTHQEAFAEVYAALQHVREFGVSAQMIPRRISETASSVFWGAPGDMVYYYQPYALEYVDSLKHGPSLQRLSPEETVTLAARIVNEYAMSPVEQERICDAARSCQQTAEEAVVALDKKQMKALQAATDDVAVRKIMATMLAQMPQKPSLINKVLKKLHI